MEESGAAAPVAVAGSVAAGTTDEVVRRRERTVHPDGSVLSSRAAMKSRRESQEDILKSASELIEVAKMFIESRKDPAVTSQYHNLYVFLGGLDRVLSYLNVGQGGSSETRKFIFTAVQELSTMEVSLLILYGALVIGFHTLDATPTQYTDERNNIHESVEFVKVSITQILDNSNKCLRLLQEIIEVDTGSPMQPTQPTMSPLRTHTEGGDRAVTVDEAKLARLERLFQEELRQANVTLQNAEDCVTKTRSIIRKANSEIKGHLLVAGGVKVGIIGCGVFGLWYLYKHSNITDKKIPIAAGVGALSVFWLISGVPRYAKLQREFRTYNNQVVQLKSRLRMLRRQIDSLVPAFEKEAADARVRTNSENKLQAAACAGDSGQMGNGAP